MSVVAKVLYWVAVVAISIVLLVVLISLFESRDESELDGAAGPASSVKLDHRPGERL